MEKGQVASQIFIYLLALIIVGLIAIIGHKGVTGLLHKQCLADIASFREDLSQVVYDSRDFGESRVFEHRMPCGYTLICFLDTDYINTEDKPKYQAPFVEENSEANNVFLIKSPQPARADYVTAFNISKLSLGKKYVCMDASGGKLRILLEGNGRKGTKIHSVSP